jgi:hypothetical protein
VQVRDWCATKQALVDDLQSQAIFLNWVQFGCLLWKKQKLLLLRQNVLCDNVTLQSPLCLLAKLAGKEPN